jgi:hypothetical protein
MMKEKIKVGLLIDNYKTPNWIYKIIKEIRNSEFSEIVLIIKKERNSNLDITKSSNKKNSVLYDFHLKLDKYLWGRQTDFNKIKDAKNLLYGIEEIKVITIQTNSEDKFEQRDIEKIKSYNLDVLLKFGFKSLNGDILNVSKYGVWSYIHGNDQINRSGSAGYREVVQKCEITGSVLQILNNQPDGGKVIYRSWMRTDAQSITKNQNIYFWKASTFIPRILENLFHYGEAYIKTLERKFNNDNNRSTIKLSDHPRNLTALKNIFKHLWSAGKNLYHKKLYRGNWFLLYKYNSNDIFTSPMRSFRALKPPKDRFWADPFVITKEDKHYIFMEELLYKTNKGHISVIELDKQGKVLHIEKILDKPYHLSYPFIFEYEDCYYMIPESRHNKTIELYKCAEFPYKWDFVMNLMENVNAVDTTLYYHNKKWWLFCSVDMSGLNVGATDELHLFYSDTLFTNKWNKHPNNPIDTDTRTARPAGKVFKYNNNIYRPSQDCSGLYGKAINFNQIIKLDELEYEESCASKILPDWDKSIKATHTFNFNNEISVIDGFTYIRR